MAKILLLYSTRDGHTREISWRMQQTLAENGHEVTLAPISDAPVLDMQSFDKIVVGASIRYGKHSPRLYEFVEANVQLLDSKPNAFFSVNVVARKPGKDRPDTNPYLRKFLKQIAWHPRELAVFAGKIDYPRYGFWDRLMIRLIMWVTRGPTDPTAVVEFTNWGRVESFAHRISEM
jgi:menaquinone-dependent protoporphyrinogen oxidase